MLGTYRFGKHSLTAYFQCANSVMGARNSRALTSWHSLSSGGQQEASKAGSMRQLQVVGLRRRRHNQLPRESREGWCRAASPRNGISVERSGMRRKQARGQGIGPQRMRMPWGKKRNPCICRAARTQCSWTGVGGGLGCRRGWGDGGVSTRVSSVHSRSWEGLKQR